MRTISLVALVLVLAAGASATVISDAQTWTFRTSIGQLPGQTLELAAGGELTMQNRLDGTGVSSTIPLMVFNGGTLNQTIHDAVPDNDGWRARLGDDPPVGAGSNIVVLLNSGTWNVWRVEVDYGRMGPGGGIWIDEGEIWLETGLNGGDKYDPKDWAAKGFLQAVAGKQLVFDNATGEDWAHIYAVVPEPATMSMLGLGALALLRKRK